MDCEERTAYRFDPVDLEQMRLLGRLPPGRRITVMLEARELAVGLMRGRLRRQYPHMSSREINLKLLEELDRSQNPGRGCHSPLGGHQGSRQTRSQPA